MPTIGGDRLRCDVLMCGWQAQRPCRRFGPAPQIFPRIARLRHLTKTSVFYDTPHGLPDASRILNGRRYTGDISSISRSAIANRRASWAGV